MSNDEDKIDTSLSYLPDGSERITDYIKHLGEESLVFFDLETSGLSPLVHEIIEIAGVKVFANGEIQTFEAFAKPETAVTDENSAIHGIKNSDLEGEASISEVLPRFIDFCGNSGLVAYNAQFDVGFLTVDAWKCGIKFNNQKVYDAFQLTKNLLKLADEEVENFKLGTIAGAFGFKADYHRALADSEACLFVIDQCLKRIKNESIELDSIRKNYELYQLNDFKSFNLPEINSDLKEALKTGKNIEISYNGGSKGSRLREIKPIAILPMPYGFILYAICMEDKLNKAFKLKKIQKVRVVNED